jgi:fatty acyl-ACP thioesterase B
MSVQETALNHVMCSGLAGDGFGATRQMSLRKLIWVVTRINIQVDKYSRW